MVIKSTQSSFLIFLNLIFNQWTDKTSEVRLNLALFLGNKHNTVQFYDEEQLGDILFNSPTPVVSTADESLISCGYNMTHTAICKVLSVNLLL